MNATSIAVVIEGRSWLGTERGIYCFEVSVNGVRGELQVQEDLAFEFLGAWTFDARICLDILRLHRAELAQALARKLRAVGGLQNGTYLLDWRDLKPGPLASRLLHSSSTAISAAKPSRREDDS